MNEENKTNSPKINKPVAKTGVVSVPVQKKEEAEKATEAAASADIFGEAYRKQKILNEKIKIEEQKQADSELEAPPVPVVVNEKDDDKNKKFKIIFIILVILDVVIILSSVLFLIFKDSKSTNEQNNNTSDSSAQNQLSELIVNMNSTVLKSPFNNTKYYGVEFPEGIKEEYKDLYAQNQDFAGWLTVPGTCIDTPCYQTQYPDQYYLKHDNYDQYTKYGIPYLDPGSKITTLSRNTVIYGHNFDDGLIFDELHNYQDPEYYKQYPIIEFSTPYKDYKFKIIAAFHSNGDSSGDKDGYEDYLFYYVATEFGNQSMEKFIKEIEQRSYIHTGVDVNADDKLITLSTCTYFFDRNGKLENARFAVIGRLVREGESEEIDTSLVTKNENVRYPQLYYDVFGGTNPWRNDTKWIPESK